MNRLAKIVDQTSLQTDEAVIRRLTDQWFYGWSPKNQKFTGKELEPLFAKGERNLLVFDNVGGDVWTMESWEEYRDTWVPWMQENFSYWSIRPVSEVEVHIAGDTAYTAFVWEGGGMFKDGSPVQIRQYATHVWKRRSDGRWQIVHEHLTAGKPVGRGGRKDEAA